MAPRAVHPVSSAGFTMIELVIVIAIVSIISGTLTVFMRTPLSAFRDVERRAALVDAGDHALGRLARDVETALPNSIRVSCAPNCVYLELLHTVDGGRFRENPGTNPGTGVVHAGDSDVLRLDAADASFNVIGQLRNLRPAPPSSYTGYRVAIYTTDTTELYLNAVGKDLAGNPAPGRGMITPAGTVTVVDDPAAGGDEHQVQLAAPHQFNPASGAKRMFLVDGPVTYYCDVAAGRLMRYWGYAVQQNQPASAALAPLAPPTSSAPTADHLSDCSFQYTQQKAKSAALLTVTLALQDHGEAVRLLRQIHVDNSP